VLLFFLFFACLLLSLLLLSLGLVRVLLHLLLLLYPRLLLRIFASLARCAQTLAHAGGAGPLGQLVGTARKRRRVQAAKAQLAVLNNTHVENEDKRRW